MRNKVREWIIRMEHGEEVFLIKRVDGRRVESMVFNNDSFLWRSYDDDENLLKETPFTKEEVINVLEEYAS